MNKQFITVIGSALIAAGLIGCQTPARNQYDRKAEVKDQRDLLPEQVRKGFEAEFPSAQVQSVHRDEVSGNWSIRFIDPAGHSRRAEFDSTGRWDRNAALP